MQSKAGFDELFHGWIRYRRRNAHRNGEAGVHKQKQSGSEKKKQQHSGENGGCNAPHGMQFPLRVAAPIQNVGNIRLIQPGLTSMSRSGSVLPDS